MLPLAHAGAVAELRLIRPMAAPMTTSQHVDEIRPRKDRREVDLISDQIPRSACAMQDGIGVS